MLEQKAVDEDEAAPDLPQEANARMRSKIIVARRGGSYDPPPLARYAGSNANFVLVATTA
jgi:hypothetical protein